LRVCTRRVTCRSQQAVCKKLISEANQSMANSCFVFSAIGVRSFWMTSCATSGSGLPSFLDNISRNSLSLVAVTADPFLRLSSGASGADCRGMEPTLTWLENCISCMKGESWGPPYPPAMGNDTLCAFWWPICCGWCANWGATFGSMLAWYCRSASSGPAMYRFCADCASC
jgi:hypothetical protein